MRCFRTFLDMSSGTGGTFFRNPGVGVVQQRGGTASFQITWHHRFWELKFSPPHWDTPIASGQIIATSHDFTPNGGLVRESPLFLFQGNLGW